MVSDSDIHISNLDAVLERFAVDTNEYKSRIVNDQSSQSETNVGSNGSVVVLRDGDYTRSNWSRTYQGEA